ncbi:MAG: AIR synthase-related protein, partial [candidate division NC10 bacterium]
DAILLTKGIPLEGAAIIARERGAELERRGLPVALIERAKQFLHRPGLSVVPEALLACELAPVHAMHDPTEGGIATACWELAQAAGVGLRVERERIPVFPEGERFCREFGLDPLGTIASGALLLTLAPADAAVVLHACAREGIDCAFVGQVVPKEEGVVLVESGRSAPMPLFPQDEITKIFREP